MSLPLSSVLLLLLLPLLLICPPATPVVLPPKPGWCGARDMLLLEQPDTDCVSCAASLSWPSTTAESGHCCCCSSCCSLAAARASL
jgi:hypothetical protein